ncbi:MAG TPA: transcription elongation factor GreB [Gammaproteobacteria bacterium]
MGRYRPPAIPASKYITPEGKQRLDAELTFLWRTKRPQVCQAVAEAAAQGDRSENAEYIYGKKQLREIDARVRFLRKRLDGMVVVERPPSDTTRIYFGAWVRLEDEAGREQIHRIVGPDEFDADPRYISLDSPLAKALLKKGLDDEVEVELPRGTARFIVTAISYQPLET